MIFPSYLLNAIPIDNWIPSNLQYAIPPTTSNLQNNFVFEVKEVDNNNNIIQPLYRTEQSPLHWTTPRLLHWCYLGWLYIRHHPNLSQKNSFLTSFLTLLWTISFLTSLNILILYSLCPFIFEKHHQCSTIGQRALALKAILRYFWVGWATLIMKQPSILSYQCSTYFYK